MRFGGPVYATQPDPHSWVQAHRAKGYRAAYCPLKAGASREEIQAYASAAKAADLVIAEVGAWVNVLEPDPLKRKQNMDYNKQQLALADEIGARCCVNIAGSRGEKWDGPCELDLLPETFEMVVANTREIIDEVKPRRAFYTIEPMPWMFPDSPDSYLDLVKAIDRKQFGVHFDPVNWINSPRRYFENAVFLRECFQKLGQYIVSVHAKDTLLGQNLTTQLFEARPGLGKLNYRVFLQEMAKLPDDTPLMLEHLPSEQEYDQAAQYVREVAEELEMML